MAKKKRVHAQVLVRTWYGAMLGAPLGASLGASLGAPANATAPRTWVSRAAATQHALVNKRGVLTMAEIDAPRPSTACFGAPLPGGSMDDTYFPRVVFVPVPLEAAEGRLGLHMPQRRPMADSVCGLGLCGNDGVPRKDGSGGDVAAASRRAALDSAPAIARALLEQVPIARLRAVIDSGATSEQLGAAWCAEVRFSRLVKRIHEAGLRDFWARTGFYPAPLHTHRLHEAGAWALFYCHFYAAVNTAISHSHTLLSPLPNSKFADTLDSFVLFVDGVVTATPCLLEPAGGQNLFHGFTALLLESVEAACDAVCARGSWLGHCDKEVAREAPEAERTDTRAVWRELRRIMLEARKSLRVAGLASLQTRNVAEFWNVDLPAFDLFALCRAREDGRAYGYIIRGRELARCLASGRDPAVAWVALDFSRFARQLAAATKSPPGVYMPPIYSLKSRMHGDMSRSGSLIGEWTGGLGDRGRPALRTFLSRMMEECDRMGRNPYYLESLFGSTLPERPHAAVRALRLCEWSKEPTEPAFARYVQGVLSDVPLGGMISHVAGTSAHGEPLAVVAEVRARKRAAAKSAARAARKAEVAAAEIRTREHIRRRAAAERAALAGTVASLARVATGRVARDAATLAQFRTARNAHRAAEEVRIRERIRRLAATERAALAGTVASLARVAIGAAARDAAALSRRRLAIATPTPSPSPLPPQSQQEDTTTQGGSPKRSSGRPSERQSGRPSGHTPGRSLSCPPHPSKQQASLRHNPHSPKLYETPTPLARAEARAASAEARAAAAEALAAAAETRAATAEIRARYRCAMSVLRFRIETIVCQLLPCGACPDLVFHLDPFTGGIPIAALVPRVWDGGMAGPPEDSIRFAASTSHFVEAFGASVRMRVTPRVPPR